MRQLDLHWLRKRRLDAITIVNINENQARWSNLLEKAQMIEDDYRKCEMMSWVVQLSCYHVRDKHYIRVCQFNH